MAADLTRPWRQPLLRSLSMALTLVGITGAACAPASQQVGAGGSPASPAPIDRPLTIVLRGEPNELASTVSGRAAITFAMFNAPLVVLDRGVPSPVLSSVPDLNTDSWRVLPDGNME